MKGNPKIDNQVSRTGRVLRDDDIAVNMAHLFSRDASSLRTIQAEDAEAIEGNLFKAQLKFSLVTATVKFLAFKTPPATEENPLYVLWGKDFIKSDVNNFDYELYENIAFTLGAEQPVVNQNRVLKDVVLPGTKLYPTPTNINPIDLTDAKKIDIDVILNSQGTARSSGGSAADAKFLILRPDTNHVIKFYNNDPQTAIAFITSTFLEALIPTLYSKVNP